MIKAFKLCRKYFIGLYIFEKNFSYGRDEDVCRHVLLLFNRKYLPNRTAHENRQSSIFAFAGAHANTNMFLHSLTPITSC